MPQGLQVWDASSNVMLDTTQKTARLTGVLQVNYNSPSSYIDVPFQTGEKVFFFVYAKGNFGVYFPDAAGHPNRIGYNWSGTPVSTWQAFIYYGVTG
jgi:hypothetical protein